MPSREPQPGRQIGPPGESDSRWDAIWQLVLQAEQLPAGERSAFMQSAETDPFIIRQAAAILEGSESLATATGSVPRAPEERFVPQTGMKIGRYRVGTLLGSGGAGSVYAAFDEELNRPVAIKFVSSRRSGSSDAPALPLREARAASALNHPNIIMIHEVIETGETAAIVMELVKGVTLRAAAQKGPSLDEVLHWSTQLAHALAVAHSHGLIHGDIKPENVMVREDGYIKLLDFGLALDAQPRETRGSQLAGTLRYLAPERCLGQPPTQAGDVFAFGVILYELTTGRYPYEAETTLGLLQAITEKEVPRPATLRPDLPAALDRLIAAMLARRAEERPTARQVADKLTEAAEQTPRRPMTIGIISALILLAVIAGVVLWTRRTQAPTINFRALTSTDAENRVTAAAIAPDGSQFAYADVTGAMFVRSIESKRTRLLRHPPSIVVEKMAWFPDLSALFVVGRPLSEGNYSAWIVRLDGADAKLVRENIDTASLSPDGSRIVFTSADSREIWLTDLNSNLPARMLASAGENETFPLVIWSAKGKYLICQRLQLGRIPQDERAPDFEPRIQRTYESIDASTGTVGYRRPDIAMGSATVLPDGRVLFLWPNVQGYSTDVWQMKTDPETGKIQESPRALAEYRERALAEISASSDGMRIVVVDYRDQADVYVADFDVRTKRLAAIRRVTMDLAGDLPHSFSPDGQTVFFESSRNGTYDIFRQGLDNRHAEFLAGRPDRVEFNPLMTPDGKWVLYLSTNATTDHKDRVLERIPVDGGEPATVPTGGNLDYFDCALPGHKRCVMRTTENQEYVFYDLDPVRGKGAELARVPWSPGIMGDWAISTDGSEVAIPNHDFTERFIRVVPLGSPGALGHVVRLKGGAGMISGVHYSADGAGWFVVLRRGDKFFRASPLLKVDLVYVDRQGSITPLREIPIPSWAVAGARGRITFPDGVMTGNAILIER